tara:strand:- start:704 stop:874 length:171 start_codon:yes stop_codon:yes gene_type:complete
MSVVLEIRERIDEISLLLKNYEVTDSQMIESIQEELVQIEGELDVLAKRYKNNEDI